MKNLKNKKGFTLVELIIVLAIFVVIMAVALPSVTGYVSAGSQLGRMHTARSAYLAAQEELTYLKNAQNLSSFAASAAPVPYGVFPYDTPDKDSIYYIFKPRGEFPDNPVTRLLDPVMANKDFLSESIIIEFNKTTGAVLSLFHSESADLGYEEEAGKDSIAGPRPYTLAGERKQGYYGAEVASAPLHS